MAMVAQMLLIVFKLYSSHEKNLKQATKQHLAGLWIGQTCSHESDLLKHIFASKTS